MCAGPKYEYMWADGQAVKKPMSVSAPRYVDYLMTWVQGQLDDEKLFPTQLGVPFPANFQEHARALPRMPRASRSLLHPPPAPRVTQCHPSQVRNIFRRLFRIYAHIYYCHFDKISELGAEPHLNTCFKHFMYFVKQFHLIQNEQEVKPLEELIHKLLEHGNGSAASSSQAPPEPDPAQQSMRVKSHE